MAPRKCRIHQIEVDHNSSFIVGVLDEIKQEPQLQNMGAF